MLESNETNKKWIIYKTCKRVGGIKNSKKSPPLKTNNSQCLAYLSTNPKIIPKPMAIPCSGMDTKGSLNFFGIFNATILINCAIKNSVVIINTAS